MMSEKGDVAAVFFGVRIIDSETSATHRIKQMDFELQKVSAGRLYSKWVFFLTPRKYS